jgi:hypothetical protein
MVPGAPQKEATPALSWADFIQKDALDRDEKRVYGLRREA